MTSGWAPFLLPETWTFLGGGLLITLRISAVTVALSLVLGTALALGSISRLAAVRRSALVYVVIIRGVPVFLIILLVYFGLGRLNIHVGVGTSVTISLVVYTTAYISEIVRGGVLAIAQGQMDGALALALTRFQAFRHVILPQALRIMVPALVNRYIIAINGTSIGAVIGLDELLRRSVILYNGHQNPIQTLIVTGSIYAALLFSLSMASRRLEWNPAMQPADRLRKSWWQRLWNPGTPGSESRLAEA